MFLTGHVSSGLLLAPASRPRRPRSSSSSNRSPSVVAAGNSPWGSPPSGSGKGGSSGQGSKGKSKATGGSKQKGAAAGRSGRDAAKKPKSSTSGQGFAPQAPAKPPPPPVYTITPPLTPQLLDELSPWESAAAPLWGTFCGHCEGEWLGQYSAYTPWGGDPEPVWADESGAYLTHAFCRVSEDRQSVPADAADGKDTSSSSSPAASQDEMLDVLVRATQRSASISSLIGGVSAATAAAAAAAAAADAASPAAAAAATSAESEEDGEDLEAIAYNVNGSVVFNGGSYSLGPEEIQVPELTNTEAADYYAALQEAAAAPGGGGTDAGQSSAGEQQQDEEEGDGPADPLSVLPYSTVVVEQVLVAAGDRRLRLVATLKLRRPPGQELDIEIARLLLYREFWYGTADSTGSSSSSSRGGAGAKQLQLLPSHSFEVPVTQLTRPQPSDLGGTWNVFVIAATPAVEENPNTLQMETVVLYSSREERQHWHVPTLTSSAAPAGSSGAAGSSGEQQVDGSAGGGDEDGEDSGGSFWLPGGAVVTLRMVSNPLHEAAGSDGGNSSSNGSSGGSRAHRGLLIGLHMLDGTGSCLFVEREYDPAGCLFEVRQGTAVKGGWSGGRM